MAAVLRLGLFRNCALALLVIAGGARAQDWDDIVIDRYEFHEVPADISYSYDYRNHEISYRIINRGSSDINWIEYSLTAWDCQSSQFDTRSCLIVAQGRSAPLRVGRGVGIDVPPGQARDYEEDALFAFDFKRPTFRNYSYVQMSIEKVGNRSPVYRQKSLWEKAKGLVE